MKRVEFPLGEVTTLSPLLSMGILPRPEIDPRGITGKEGWKAQGLEGKAFIIVDDAIADVIFNKLGQYRCRIRNIKGKSNG